MVSLLPVKQLRNRGEPKWLFPTSVPSYEHWEILGWDEVGCFGPWRKSAEASSEEKHLLPASPPNITSH